MRIIAGQHRSRRLATPPDKATTRPITDRVREALFSKLDSLGLTDGGQVLDVFAGTGCIGLEALSRGCDQCTFIERDRSIAKLLQQNIQTLGLESETKVKQIDALGVDWHMLVQQTPIRLVFCDPPYKLVEEAKGMSRVINQLSTVAKHLTDDGLMMFRTPAKVDLPEELPGLELVDLRKYGSMKLHFLSN